MPNRFSSSAEPFSKWFAVLLLALVFLSPSLSARAEDKPISLDRYTIQTQTVEDAPRVGKDSLARVLLEKAVSSYVGIPYRRGGTGFRGIDCSGLTRRCYAETLGIELPHSALAQRHVAVLRDVPMKPEVFRPLDLLFFATKRKRVNHVGIYLFDGKFLHATSKGGVIVSHLREKYWKRRLVAARRPETVALRRLGTAERKTVLAALNSAKRLHDTGGGTDTPKGRTLSSISNAAN